MTARRIWTFTPFVRRGRIAQEKGSMLHHASEGHEQQSSDTHPGNSQPAYSGEGFDAKHIDLRDGAGCSPQCYCCLSCQRRVGHRSRNRDSLFGSTKGPPDLPGAKKAYSAEKSKREKVLELKWGKICRPSSHQPGTHS